MMDKLLRAPLPDQFKALLEKLDTELDTSSLQKINRFLRDYESCLTRYERLVFKREIRKVNRRIIMDAAMAVVINVPEPESEYTYKETMRIDATGRVGIGGRNLVTASSLVKDSLQIIQKEYEQYTSAKRQADQLYGAQAKAEGARVNY